MTTRTDPHAPSKIIPADYSYLCSYSLATTHEGWPIPAWNIDLVVRYQQQYGLGGVHHGPGQCDVYGARFIYGDLWLHTPTQRVVHLGHECADKYELLADRAEFKRVRAALLVQAEKAARRAYMRTLVRKQLSETAGLADDLRTARKHHIVADIRSRFIQWGNLSTAQVALVHKIAEEIRHPRVEAPKVPAPEGRTIIEGTVVCTKVQATDFGDTIKMLVVVATTDGEWRCWSTVPNGVALPLKDKRIRFRATLKRSNDDTSFAFASRPTNAEVL